MLIFTVSGYSNLQGLRVVPNFAFSTFYFLGAIYDSNNQSIIMKGDENMHQIWSKGYPGAPYKFLFAVSPDDSCIYIGIQIGTLLLYEINAADGTPKRQIIDSTKIFSDISQVFVSPDSTKVYLTIKSSQGQVWVWIKLQLSYNWYYYSTDINSYLNMFILLNNDEGVFYYPDFSFNGYLVIKSNFTYSGI